MNTMIKTVREVRLRTRMKVLMGTTPLNCVELTHRLKEVSMNYLTEALLHFEGDYRLVYVEESL